MQALAHATLAAARGSPSGVCPAPASFGSRLKAAPDRNVAVVCDPQGAPEKTLKGRLRDMESKLVELASAHNNLDLAVGNLDKSRLSALNKMFTENVGDMILGAGLDLVGLADRMMSGIQDNLVEQNLLRKSRISDEGVYARAGRNLPLDMGKRLDHALKAARNEIDLRDYHGTLVVPYGANASYEYDLESLSRVLRHPEMLLAWKCSVSNPRRISARERPGFVMEELRALENRQNDFLPWLPRSFRMGGRGLPEILMPFGTSLTREGVAKMDRGIYLEIKLKADERESRKLLPFTKDTAGWKGTKKGFAEAYSGVFGIRGFNTFLTPAETNFILSPIPNAMKDLQIRTGVDIKPKNGGYQHYWADMDSGSATIELIRKAVERRIHCKEDLGPGYADLGFEPSITVLDAKGMDVSEVRARFILKSLGREYCAPQALDMTDFLLNFIENVHPIFQQRVYAGLSSDGGGMSIMDKKNIEALEWVCAQRRTIRDTEDLVWVLRKDTELPSAIASRRADLEQWLFDFSSGMAGRMFSLLAQDIAMLSRKK